MLSRRVFYFLRFLHTKKKKNGKEFIGKASKAHKITLTTKDLTSKAFIYSMQKTKELNFSGDGHPEAIKLDLGDEYDTSR